MAQMRQYIYHFNPKKFGEGGISFELGMFITFKFHELTVQAMLYAL